MTWSRLAFFWLFLVAGSISAVAQAPVADFSAPASACLNEAFFVTDQSQSTESYEWDFCEVDLASTPTFNSMGVIPGLTTMLDIKVVQDGVNWRGFVCDGDGNKIYRLDFGTSLTNTPTVSPNATLNTPSGIDFVRLGNNWYGLVGTFNLPSHLFILDFGDSPTNDPAIIDVNLGANNLQNSRSLKLVQEGNDYVALIANWGQSKITRVNFGPVISATPQSVDLDIDAFGHTNLYGIATAEDATGKYALVTTYGDHQLLKFSFGSSWLNTPTKTIVNAGSISNPTNVQIEFEGNNFYAMLMLNSGNLLRLNFGSDLTSVTPLVDDLGTFSNMTSVRGMHVVRNANSYTMLTTSFITGELYRLDFNGGSCGASLQTSSVPSPLVSYSGNGNHVITLRARGSDLLTDALSKTVSVSATAAPDLTIGIVNKQCLGQPNEFSTSSNESITSEAWTFGDTQSSSSISPAHTFAAPGLYEVTVKATATSGCNNIAQSTITVFNQPDFDLPASNPICTKQEYAFINTTDFDVDAAPAWEWKVNGVAQSGDVDMHYVILTADPHVVELVASNAECTGSASKSLSNLLDGPQTDFTVSDACAGDAVAFTNTTTGETSSYQWDFGDGTQSTEHTPTKSFTNAGQYDVLLTASNSGGCENFKTRTLTVFSKPQPAFSIDLPPFSCAGSPSQFHDLTPGPDDSNLQTWTWVMGDGAIVSTQDPAHMYALPGEYAVQLTVVTDKACSGQIIKDIIISESPAVDFIYSTPCVNTPVQFTSSTGPTVDTWAWKIGNVTSPSPNPTHTFISPGDYAVELTVTAANNCLNEVTNSVHVPIVPTIDISISSACVGTAATLSATSSGSDDLTANYSWDLGGGGAIHEGQTILHTFPQVGSYSVDLEATTETGCRYEYNEDVLIHPIPLAGFTPQEQYGPAPLTVNFTNASIGATSYEWLFDGQGGTSSEASPAFTYTELGTYPVTLHATSDAGCTGSSGAIVYVIVPHADLVLEDFALFTDPLSNLTKGILQIRNNGNYPISAVDLIFDMGSGIIITERMEADIDPLGQSSVATNSTLSFQSGEPGFICVTASIPNDENVNDNVECLTLGESSKLFETYPNPSNGHLSIQVVGTADEELFIEIVNGTGADAYSVTVDVHTGLNNLELDLTTVSPGIYVLRMSTASSGVTTQRIVIQP